MFDFLDFLDRPELWHPIVSHFPIVLLTFTPFLATLLVFNLPTKVRNFIDTLFQGCLYLGMLTYLITLYLGDVALDIAKPTTEYLVEIYKHEELAKDTLIPYVFAILLYGIKAWRKWLGKKEVVANGALAIILFFAFYMLIKTSHGGGILVYDLKVGVG
jgi:uncharacterized membrane protein